MFQIVSSLLIEVIFGKRLWGNIMNKRKMMSSPGSREVHGTKTTLKANFLEE